MKKEELYRIKLVSVLGFLLAIFLAFNISAFAVEESAVDEPLEGEVIETEIIVEEPAVTSNNLAEPEELLDDYIEVLTKEYAESHDAVSFEAKDGIIPSKLRGAKLTGADKAVYDYLKERIEEVARGENIDVTNEDYNGLVCFTIPYSDIYSAEALATHYTADDLGLDAIVVNDEISDDVVHAIYERYTFDMRKVLVALLCDYPYQLFWFDKTVGVFPDSECIVGAQYNNGEWEAYCSTDESTVTLYFAVSMDYAPDNYYGHDFNGDGQLTPIQTDIEKIKSLSIAVENAMEVVTDASKEKTDYDKLDFYREWICDEVEYDYAAVKAENNTPYGDPWQLIYAFDGNEDTKAIVCEGYSKAFKYLCDLTTFSSDVDCRLVMGDMDDGTGAGPHMWNLVEINKANYLVDITNCDEGSIGYDRYLFMRGDKEKSPEGYTITIPETESSLAYIYDDDTKNAFDSSELTLAENDYVEGASGGNGGGDNNDPDPGLDPESTSNLITTVDMGNVWEYLDPLNEVPFTAEIHDEDDEDGRNFNDKMEIVEEKWVNINDKNDVVSTSQHGRLKAGETYEYFVTIRAKDGWKFLDDGSDEPSFKFIIGGTEIDLNEMEYTLTDTELVIAPLENNLIIPRIDVSYAGISGISNRTYNGKAQTQNPLLEVIVNGTSFTLVNGTDYTLSYKNNTNAGTATVTITGKGNFEGSVETTFTINKLSISKATITGVVKKTYSGKALTQSPTIKFDGKTLEKGTDYTLSYKNNVKVGTATMVITGKGTNFSGTKNVTFKINKAKNPLAIKAKTKNVSFTTLKKKNLTFKVGNVIKFSKKGAGKMTYVKASGNKKITINKKTGAVTVKKGLKKGTYKVKVKATAAGNANYNKLTKAVTFTIKVK